MGEVLENGVYLPDEGERNAYNGLKGNWNTVDTVVAQVQALSSTGLIRKPVDELPTEDIETNVIYMLKAVKPNGDVYRIEYMYIDGHWDALGTSETTLDDYYTKAETDDLPAVKSGINATKVSNYDAHLANNDVHVTLANKQSWDGKQAALDVNQTAAVNSGVNATKVTGYDTHVSDTDIHVTTSDKTAWNAKQDGLSQTQLAAVNSGVTEAKRTGYDSHVADTDVHVTTADKAAWNGKQNALTQTQLDNIAAVPDKADSADLATVATTGDYGDLLNAPTIPTVNNASLTIQKNGTDVATFTANASSNVTANLSIPVNTSDLNNDAGFLTQHNPIDNELSATSENALQNKVVKSELDGKAPLVHTHAASDVTSGTFNIARIPNLDASKITSGTIDIARLPKGSLERLVKVADQAARYALTTDDVQLGDTVQQLDTGVMYVVTDETKLNSADGYTEFTAGAASSVPWTGVTGKPNDYPPSSHTHTKSQITDFPALATVATSGSYNDLNNIPASFTPSSHTHGNVTNDGKLPTASRALISDSSKKITVSSVTDTELGYLSGVTSSVQTQIDGKANDSSVVHKTENEDISGTKTFSAIIKNKLNNAEIAVIPSSTLSTAFRVCDKNDAITANLQYNQYTTGNSDLQLNLRTKDSNNNNISRSVILNTDQYGTWFYFRPSDNSAIALGSASYKWKSVYADSYYLGTTAFGDIATHNASEFSASNHVHGNISNDGKVGTTANKPLITGTGGVVQAGSFGNAANTFCEGNDSRLSDARTPVAHTHTKSDVTDLLNSNFIPSSDANYTLGSSDLRWKQIWCSGYKTKSGNIDFTDSATTGSSQSWWIDAMEKNGTGFFGVGSIRAHSLGLNEEHFRIKNAGGKWADLYIQLGDNNQFTIGTAAHSDVTNNGFKGKFIPLDSFIPNANNSYDLGSSSYQWKSVYAQSYYYNSTEFQEKFATLDTVQTISERKNLKQYWHLIASNLKAGAGETYGRTGYSFIYTDKNDVTLGDVTLYKQAQATRTYLRLQGGDYYTDGVPDAAGTLVQSTLRIGTLANGTRMIECITDAMYPANDNATDLGTSTNKWTTLNGVNPGALSLPNLNYSDSNQWIDLSGNITDETGGTNEYDPTVDGWVVIRADNNPTSLRVNVHAPRPSTRKYVSSATGVAINGTMIVSVPAPAGSRVYIYFNKGSGSLDSATFITCQGNV